MTTDPIAELEAVVSDMLRRFGVEAVVDEDGATIAAASPLPDKLPPLEGYGDTVCRGDLIRVYYLDGLFRRQPPDERLDLDRVLVHDYDADGGWMVVLPEHGLEPRQGPTSFSLQGPGSRPSWRRRLEIVPPDFC